MTAAAESVVAGLQETILDHLPDAAFEIRVAVDSRIYLTVYSEVSNDFVIQDLVAEQTVDAMLRGDAKVHVMPRPLSQLIWD